MHSKQKQRKVRTGRANLGVEQIYSKVSTAGWDVCLYVDMPLSHLIQGLKYKVKVLLRSQSKFIPPLLVNGRLAYGDTKGRSISIADGAVRGGSQWN